MERWDSAVTPWGMADVTAWARQKEAEVVLGKKERGFCRQEGASCRCSDLPLPTEKEMQEPWSSQLTPEQNCRAVKSLGTEGGDICLQTASLHPLEPGWRWRSLRRCHLAGKCSGTWVGIEIQGKLGQSLRQHLLPPPTFHDTPQLSLGNGPWALTPFPPCSWSQTHQGRGLAPKWILPVVPKVLRSCDLSFTTAAAAADTKPGPQAQLSLLPFSWDLSVPFLSLLPEVKIKMVGTNTGEKYLQSDQWISFLQQS